jgi:hypothetical protein
MATAAMTAMTAAAMTAAETTASETMANAMMAAKATAVPRASDDDAATIATLPVSAVRWAVPAIVAPSVALISGILAAAQPERDCDHQRHE